MVWKSCWIFNRMSTCQFGVTRVSNILDIEDISDVFCIIYVNVNHSASSIIASIQKFQTESYIVCRDYALKCPYCAILKVPNFGLMVLLLMTHFGGS